MTERRSDDRDPLPRAAALVVIGSGIVGASAAYHLAKRGWTDVVVVDQGPIPAAGGSTSHAPGGFFATNYSRTMTRLALETVRLLSSLDVDGQPCFFPVGTLELARTPERWEDHKRKVAAAHVWGMPDARLLDPDQTRELIPMLAREAFLGAYHCPDDGVGKPLRSVTALVNGATAAGVAFHGETRVTGFDIRAGQLHGVETDHGTIETPLALVCAGIWGPLVGRMLRTPVPLQPCEHLYAITTPVASLAGETREVVHPMLRDQDKAMYYRQQGDRYGVGTYQHPPLLVDSADIRPHGSPVPAGSTSVNPHGETLDMPSNRPFQAEHFAWGWNEALRLMPELASTRVDYTLQGMFSFTPDGFPLMGESPAVRGAWFAEAIWLTHGGAAGRLIADWVTDGDPGMDVHELDLHRFEPVQTTRAYVRTRGARNYDEVYDLIHPLQPLGVARPLRRAPFHDRLDELGAEWFEGKGWERAQWFGTNAPEPTAARTGWAAQFWATQAATEHRATRERVGLFDLTSLTRIVVTGPDAERFVQRIATNDLAVPAGTVVYSAVCNPGGGVRSDITFTRLADDRYQLGVNGPQDLGYLRRARLPDERVEITEITSGTCAVGIWGPRARELMQSLSPDDLSNEAFPYLTARDIELLDVPVLAQRISYAGELGWELYAEAAIGGLLWDRLWEAGRPFGLIACGRAAYDGLRMEKGYRSWGTDITEEDDPYEAGIGFTVRLGKGEFVGRDALARKKETGRRRALAWVGLDDPAHVVLGREPVRSGDELVGYVRSAAYGYCVGRDLTSVMLPVELAMPGTPLTIEWFGERLPATVLKDPVWDPAGARIRA